MRFRSSDSLFCLSSILFILFSSIVTLPKALAFQLPRTSRAYTNKFQKRRLSFGKQRFYRHDHLHLDEASTEIPSYQYGVLGKKGDIVIDNVERLRSLVLDERKELRHVQIQNYVKEAKIDNHQVLKLIQERYDTYSTPGNRHDNATLALAMEGGGMRGCVSAGMAAAIASLGLSDVFDTIYGSSAGSVIGAYMISRQMCVDVYVDILPAAQRRFVCKRRLVRSIASNLANVILSTNRKKLTNVTSTLTPGMNISYVLDGIMDLEHGLRPLDLKKFQENNKFQKLRVVASALDTDGNLVSKVFGNEDFFDNPLEQLDSSIKRKGLFACLQASMTVPGATGPPVKLWDPISRTTASCFDAFCFEPIPYRSAVEEGATHVLALCTRPDGFDLKTKPGVYEQGVAPLYFNSHGFGSVSRFFEQGGQQFIYAEDLLTLEEGKGSQDKVLVPPPKCFHGVQPTFDDRRQIQERETGWKRAHLLPLKIGSNTPELAVLEQDKDAVLEAVRGGFAAAFDILAPIVGVENLELSGDQVSKLVFPSDEDLVKEQTVNSNILTNQVHVPGQDIPNYFMATTSTSTAQEMLFLRDGDNDTLPGKKKRFRLSIWKKLLGRRRRRRQQRQEELEHKNEVNRVMMSALSMERQFKDSLDLSPAQALLNSLPGFNGERGGFHHLSKGLRNQIGS
jgi:hypothetical protein